jgi:hypothetical protein
MIAGQMISGQLIAGRMMIRSCNQSVPCVGRGKGFETVSHVVASTSKGFETVSYVVASASKGFAVVSHGVASAPQGFARVSYVSLQHDGGDGGHVVAVIIFIEKASIVASRGDGVSLPGVSPRPFHGTRSPKGHSLLTVHLKSGIQ